MSKKKVDPDAPKLIEFAYAQDELNRLKKEVDPNAAKSRNPFARLLDFLFELRDSHVKRPVNRKKYLWLCLLGIFGAHRFYAHQYWTAVFYLLTCWTGFSGAMTIIDVMIALPMKPDENGNIMM